MIGYEAHCRIPIQGMSAVLSTRNPDTGTI